MDKGAFHLILELLGRVVSQSLLVPERSVTCASLPIYALELLWKFV